MKQEEIKCPFCGKGIISVLITEDTYSQTIARAFGKSKSIPKLVKGKTEVFEDCPVCKKTKKEIKYALEHGNSKQSHEKIIKRIKKSGLPTQLEF